MVRPHAEHRDEQSKSQGPAASLASQNTPAGGEVKRNPSAPSVPQLREGRQVDAERPIALPQVRRTADRDEPSHPRRTAERCDER